MFFGGNNNNVPLRFPVGSIERLEKLKNTQSLWKMLNILWFKWSFLLKLYTVYE